MTRCTSASGKLLALAWVATSASYWVSRGFASRASVGCDSTKAISGTKQTADFIDLDPESPASRRAGWLRTGIVATIGQGCGQIPAFRRGVSAPFEPVYQELCPAMLGSAAKRHDHRPPALSMSVTHAAESTAAARAPLALWVGAAVYAVFVLAGNHLLIDPDTMWQITVGQWILDQGAVPTTDVYSFTMRGQPWISTQWLAQAAYAQAYALAGWTGPV